MTLVRVLLMTLALLALATSAGANDVQVDKSEIRFVTKQMGVNFEGRFRKWKADIVFRPENLATSKAVLDIELAGIDLQSDDSDSEVKGPLWFDMAKFPVAHFASTSMKNVGADKFEIVGPLTMKGVTKNIVVPVVLKKDIAGTRVAEGTFIVKRLDYGIGLGLWADPETVANEVVVKIRMVLPAPT